VVPRIFFNNAGDRLKLLEIKKLGYQWFGVATNSAFWGCHNMILTAKDIGNFGNVTNLQVLENCSSLTSFPLIDTSSATSWSDFNCRHFGMSVQF
jgi:hypothetical protein